MKRMIMSAALAAFLPLGAFAGEVEFGLGESVFGHTAEVGYKVNDTFGARGFYSQGEMSYDDTFEGNDYQADLKLGSNGAFMDLYPFDGGLRLSVGAAGLEKNRLTGSTSGSAEVNGTTYATTLDMDATFENKIAPVVTVGYSKGIFGGPIKFNTDLGAVYTGGFDVTLTDRNGVIPQSEIDAETAQIRADLEKYDILPFVKVGLSLAF